MNGFYRKINYKMKNKNEQYYYHLLFYKEIFEGKVSVFFDE